MGPPSHLRARSLWTTTIKKQAGWGVGVGVGERWRTRNNYVYILPWNNNILFDSAAAVSASCAPHLGPFFPRQHQRNPQNEITKEKKNTTHDKYQIRFLTTQPSISYFRPNHLHTIIIIIINIFCSHTHRVPNTTSKFATHLRSPPHGMAQSRFFSHFRSIDLQLFKEDQFIYI